VHLVGFIWKGLYRNARSKTHKFHCLLFSYRTKQITYLRQRILIILLYNGRKYSKLCWL